MSKEYVHLIGAEEVQRAGYTMREAAAEMNRAASHISESLYQQRVFMEEWIQRLEAILKKPENT